jgi:hypothetical protein
MGNLAQMQARHDFAIVAMAKTAHWRSSHGKLIRACAAVIPARPYS